ncbi:uncharacterized protein [Haliotis cracherodii]|uniref:uncharacterized protein n=1 Tax=Haliotis cracherodii TaxID=6455 RepID=UPI0039E88BCF
MKSASEVGRNERDMSRPRQIASLQEQCRRSILARISIRHVQQVARLPLPCVVKDFLTTFRFTEDFDLSGMYIDYNFNFPHHAHHRTHQVHPGICTLDATQVLLKCLSDQPCELCGTAREDFRLSRKEREIWESLKHTNLQNCLLSNVKNQHNMTCYVLEFPLMNIQEYAYKVFMSGNVVPEYLVWETLLKLTSVFLYLETEKVEAWDLCQPEHVVIDNRGEIKLENLLLYSPARNLIKPRRNVGARQPFQCAAGRVTANTIVVGIGNVISHLIAPVPTVLVKDKITSTFINHPRISDWVCMSRYSETLRGTVAQCMRHSPRPTLNKLSATARGMVNLLGPIYKGPYNLLELIRDNKV